jgi:MFS family permease
MKQFFSQYQQFLPRNPIQRDFLVCLCIWFILETLCFAIVSAITVDPVEIQPQRLFTLSVLLGVGGACLMASSTQIALSWTTPSTPRKRKRLMRFAALGLSWLGLLGIAFPLLILVFQIVLKILVPLRA